MTWSHALLSLNYCHPTRISPELVTQHQKPKTEPRSRHLSAMYVPLRNQLGATDHGSWHLIDIAVQVGERFRFISGCQ